MPKEKKQPEYVDEDYIWRFRVDDTPKERSNEDVTVKYIRRLLEELLTFVRLTYNEKNVPINGFKLTNNDDMNYTLFGKPKHHPRITTSKTQKKK